MLHERIPNLAKLVEPDRVHRLCYTDQDIFDLEIRNIFEKTWQYCGHDTQIPNAGDFWTFQIGRQPMVTVRAEDGKIHVLYNRCTHRGVQVCGSRKGHADGAFTPSVTRNPYGCRSGRGRDRAQDRPRDG